MSALVCVMFSFLCLLQTDSFTARAYEHKKAAAEELYEPQYSGGTDIPAEFRQYSHPMVGDGAWFVSFLECSTCESIYYALVKLGDLYFVLTPEAKFMNGKIGKGLIHMICFFMYEGETCMRWTQTYVDLTTENILLGVLSKDFFCGPIMHFCNDTTTFTRSTLQYYQERVANTVKPATLYANTYQDKFYEENIRENVENRQHYQILHLHDLAIDLDYHVGSAVECRQFRCCHAEESPDGDRAGAIGSTNCDLPLHGAEILLRKFKEKVFEDYNNEINIVVVTGNVVSDQPGQLDADTHRDTVKQVYELIQEVFSESFIYPVMGSTDTFPNHYFPFVDRRLFATELTPDRPKKLQYMHESVRVTRDIFADWQNKYPFKWADQFAPINNTRFTAVNSIGDFGFYKVDSMPYIFVNVTIPDDQGNIVQEIKYPDVLENTMFISLNTQACSVKNSALYETLNDPGDQIEWLEQTLFKARKDGKSVIIAGNLHPGSAKCNRQWSHRYEALIDAF